MIDEMVLRRAKRDEYKRYMGEWVAINYVGNMPEFGKVHSVDEYFLRLSPYVKTMNSGIEANIFLEEKHQPIPIDILNIFRIMDVDKNFIDTYIRASQLTMEKAVKETRKELGLDVKKIGM